MSPRPAKRAASPNAAAATELNHELEVPVHHAAAKQTVRFSGKALASASHNRNIAKTLLTGALMASAPLPTGSVYTSVPAACPIYAHVVFHECSLAFAHAVASESYPTAAVCTEPPEQPPGPFTDYFQMDTYKFIYDYPHALLSTQAHPNCGPAAAATRPLWGRNILEGSLLHVAKEVNFYRHISPLAKVEQGGTAVEALLGPPTHRDNAANHGGYTKTWHWFNTGDSWEVMPTDVVPADERKRVPIPSWASPAQRTTIRSRAEPRMAAAYAPMIRRGIDNAPIPAKIAMPSEAFLADEAALMHNYGLFSASYAPVVTDTSLHTTRRATERYCSCRSITLASWYRPGTMGRCSGQFTTLPAVLTCRPKSWPRFLASASSPNTLQRRGNTPTTTFSLCRGTGRHSSASDPATNSTAPLRRSARRRGARQQRP